MSALGAGGDTAADVGRHRLAAGLARRKLAKLIPTHTPIPATRACPWSVDRAVLKQD